MPWEMRKKRLIKEGRKGGGGVTTIPSHHLFPLTLEVLFLHNCTSRVLAYQDLATMSSPPSGACWNKISSIRDTAMTTRSSTCMGDVKNFFLCSVVCYGAVWCGVVWCGEDKQWCNGVCVEVVMSKIQVCSSNNTWTVCLTYGFAIMRSIFSSRNNDRMAILK